MSTPGSYTHFKSGESPVDLFQGTLEKFAAAHSAAKFFSIFFSSALRGTAWPLHFKFASYTYVTYCPKQAAISVQAPTLQF